MRIDAKGKVIGCIHFPKCSGCTQNSCETPPELYQRAKNYFSIPLEYQQGALVGWRIRAKLAVRGDHIGLFEKGTHDVLDIPHCKVHHLRINEAVARLKKENLIPYDEKTHRGDLRYIQCVVERTTNRVQLSLVLNMQELTPYWKARIEELYDPLLWHSIWVNFNTEPTNTIFGKSWQKIVGEDAVWEDIAGCNIAFGPSHFGQANLEMYEALIYDLREKLLDDQVVAELYAGIGSIGISLAKKCKEVRLVEIEPHAKMYFELAKAKLEPSEQNKLSYETAKADECLDLVIGASICIVDPPRKGLGKDLIQKLFRIDSLKQLAYISCDYTSLERDLEEIKRAFPSWTICFAKSYLFFPGTDQIETLVILEKTMQQ